MLAGAEFGSHLLKCCLGERYERVGAAEPAPRGPFYLLEHRHALAEIAARGAVVPAEGLAVNPPHPEQEMIALSEDASCHWDGIAHQCLGFSEALCCIKL